MTSERGSAPAPSASPPLCIIPARGGSKRLPRKNVADVGGKPMLAYTIEAALRSKLFDTVHVSTEDDGIAEIAQALGAAVPFRRPARLAGDECGVVDVCLDVLDRLEAGGHTYGTIGVLLPSSPLRRAEDIRGTYERFVESRADYAMAVTTYLHPPWQALREEEGYLRPYWGAEVIARRSQEMPPLWVDTGAVYFARVEAFRRDRTFYGRRLVGHPLPPARAIDVDDAFQLRLVRLLLADEAAGSGTR